MQTRQIIDSDPFDSTSLFVLGLEKFVLTMKGNFCFMESSNKVAIKPMKAIYRILGIGISLLFLSGFVYMLFFLDVMSSELSISRWFLLVMCIIYPAYILPVCILGRPPYKLRKL